MAKRYCSGCGQPIAPGFRICPNCGKVPEAEKPDFRVNPPVGNKAPRKGTANGSAGRGQSAGYGERYTYEPPRRPNNTQRERTERRPADGRAYAERQPRQQGGYQYQQPRQPQRQQPQPRRSAEPPYAERQRERERGDIYAERQRRAESINRASYGYGTPDLPKRNMPKKKRPTFKSKLSKFIDTSSKVVRVIINTIKIAVLLAVIYGCIYLIEVYRVKLTPYPYSTNMRLTRSNYGQAISGYFDSGSWLVNPFNATCRYKGETRHNEEMELVFSAGLDIELKEMTIDGEPVDERLFESKIMGMFI